MVSKFEALPSDHHSDTVGSSDMEDLIHRRNAFSSILNVPLDHFAFESTVLTFIHTGTGRETVPVLGHMGTLVTASRSHAFGPPLHFAPAANLLPHLQATSNFPPSD